MASKPKHMAPEGPRPSRRPVFSEGGGDDPGETSVFLAALQTSRQTQHTAPTKGREELLQERSRRIEAEAPDPFAATPFVPKAPSAPGPSPFRPQVPDPESLASRRAGASPAVESTGDLLAAYEASRSRGHTVPVEGPRHFLRTPSADPSQETPVPEPEVQVLETVDDGLEEAAVGASWDGGTVVLEQDAVLAPDGTPAAAEYAPAVGEGRPAGEAPFMDDHVDETAEAQAVAPPLVGVEPGELLPVGTLDEDPAAEARIEADEGRINDSDQEDAADADSVGRSAAMMSVLVIVSRITGFLRTWGQGAAIGGAMLASCYTVANNLPNQLYELVMGGMLVTAFLPVYLAVKKEGGRERANAYASNLASIVLVVMGAVAVLGFIFAGPVVFTQSFGATEEFDHDLAVYFFRFFVVEVVLYGLSSVFSGILNAERDYFWSTAAPIFNNIICTASFAAYALIVPFDQPLAVLLLAIGNPLGVAVQVFMQVPSLRRLGVRLRLKVDLHDPALRDTLSIGIPSIVAMVTSFVTVSVQTSSVLSATASGAAVAYYARLWYTLPYAILAIPVTTAMFTELSHAYAREDVSAFVQGIAGGCCRILFFLVPLAMLLVVFSPQLGELLNTGALTGEETTMIAGYLAALALSLPFYGICTYLQKVCSAYRRMNLYAVASIIAAVVQVAICLVLTPVWGYTVPALSSLFFFVAVDAVTFVQLRRELGALGFKSVVACFLRSAVLGVAGSVAGAALVWVLTGPVGLGGPGIVTNALICVVAGLPALAVTFGGALLLHFPEGSFIRSMVGRLGGRAA